MAKDFRTNVEFNNDVTIFGNLNASVGMASFKTISASSSTDQVLFQVDRPATGTFPLSQWRINGSNVVYIDSSGTLNLNRGMISTDISIIPTSSAVDAIQTWYNDVGSTVAHITNSGSFTFNGSTFTLSSNSSAVFNSSAKFNSNVLITGTLTASNGTTTLGTTNTGVITSTGSHVATVFHANANNTGQNFRVGDDVWIGDINVADTMSIRGLSGASSNGYIRFGSDSNNFGYNGSNLLYGTEIVAMRPQIQYSTASVTNGSTTTFIKPTGMTGISLISGVLYKYEIGIWYRVLSTNQVFKARLNYPTLTQGTAQTVIGTNTTQVSYLGGDIILTGTQLEISSTTSTNSGATQLIQRTDGFILPSANGTFSYEFAPATSSAIVFQNSYMLVTPVTAV